MKIKNIIFLLLVSAAFNLNANDISFEDIRLNGTGCPQGTTSTTISHDGKTLSLLFDEFFAEVPQYNGNNDNDQDFENSRRGGSRDNSKLSHKMCAITLKALVPRGEKIDGIEISFDFRGNTIIEHGAGTELRSQFISFKEGKKRERKITRQLARKVWNNETEDDWFISKDIFIGTPSSCERTSDKLVSFKLNNIIKAKIKNNVFAEDSFAMISFDSQDITSKMRFKLKTSRCNSGRPPVVRPPRRPGRVVPPRRPRPPRRGGRVIVRRT